MARQYIRATAPIPLVKHRLLLVLAALIWLAQPAAAQTPTRPLAPVAPPTEQSEIARLIQSKELIAALQRADAFLLKNPRDAQVRFLRGVILSEQGKAAEAIGVFETLTQDFPELPEPYNNLAVLHASQGRYEPARVLLERAIEAQPGYVTAHENLGDLHVALAAQAYQKAGKLDPNNRTVQAKLALAREIGTKVKAVK